MFFAGEENKELMHRARWFATGVHRRGPGGAASLLAVILLAGWLCLPGQAQQQSGAQVPPQGQQKAGAWPETTEGWNERLEQLRAALGPGGETVADYRIGPHDLLQVHVFEAPELDRQVRVSARGTLSLPLLGAVQAEGLTPQELERVLEELLRRRYMKDPHVSVFVEQMQSHPVAVFGAVEKPGVYQLRGQRSLIEVLSRAEGLAEDAGDTVRVTRGLAWAEDEDEPAGTTREVNLKKLLESGGEELSVWIRPGDTVKVNRAGLVYVVGEVKKPGGYVLKSNERISLLQAIALGEGLTSTAAKGDTAIIRTDPRTGERREMAVDLGDILAGEAADPLLEPNDIVFVPNSAARSVLRRGAEAAVSILTGVIIFRR